MKYVSRRRPSAAMLVAIAALVVAASGTAVAASSLVSGDKLIKKGSLSGNRLRNHTITGTQVNLSKLGKVPSAKNADHATTATSALTATSATNATNATNATTATSALTATSATNATNATNATTAANATNATTAATATRATSAASTDGYFNSGLVTLSASTTSPGVQQTLTTRGPFSFIAQCLDNGGGSYAASLIVKDNSATGAIEEDDYDSNYSPPTTLNVGDTHNVFYPTTDTTPYWYGEYYNMFSVAAPGGPALSGEGSIGVHVLGAACAFQLVLYG